MCKQRMLPKMSFTYCTFFTANADFLPLYFSEQPSLLCSWSVGRVVEGSGMEGFWDAAVTEGAKEARSSGRASDGRE